MVVRKKLIEVALPLEAINQAAADEKAVPRRGHPQTLHLWWARRPLAACRGVIFASLVDDPSSHPDRFPTIESQDAERARLFGLLERLVRWESSNDRTILDEAHREILKSTNNNPPVVYDPFCGGGSIPLEAQRLGLTSLASDINPVAVLINKALIEVPSHFWGSCPVNPGKRANKIPMKTHGAQGLAEDIRFYGNRVLQEAVEVLGSHYPKVQLPKQYGDAQAAVVAWVWARTVASPNPAAKGVHVPLVRSFLLSNKKGGASWIRPIISSESKSYHFVVETGDKPDVIDGTVNRRGAKCLLTGTAIPFDYIRSEAKAGRMKQRLMAIVAETKNGRVYLPPNSLHEIAADIPRPTDIPDTELPEKALGFRVQQYGMLRHTDLFTARQVNTLKTISNLISDLREEIVGDAVAAGMQSDSNGIEQNGTGANAYADAVVLYLSCALSRLASYLNTICFWNMKGGSVTQIFARQAVPMSWDFFEINPLVKMSGNWMGAVEWVADVVERVEAREPGRAMQVDATQSNITKNALISTDPPYYDNIGYADLSDFFYIWLRRTLSRSFPSLLATLLTPKQSELIASPFRFDGDKEKARDFFEKGLGEAFARIMAQSSPDYPITVYYAFKQVEEDGTDDEDNTNVASTGWESMLEGLLKSGLSVNATLPMRTERTSGVKHSVNALASSIVLVCRPRPANAGVITRRDFVNRLKVELPDALRTIKNASVAATDLAQAAIGPGMAVFSRYSKVLEADGSPMTVRTALALINQVLDEVNSEGEGDFDPDSRWAVSWFETHGFEEGLYGEAETLSKAKNTSTSGLVEAGLITSKAGKVKLIPIEALPEDWNPKSDNRLTVWEVTHHLIRVLETKGEEGAATLMKDVGALGEVARDLAYRLYSICERRKWAKDGMRYNGLIVSWSDVSKTAQSSQNQRAGEQMSLIG